MNLLQSPGNEVEILPVLPSLDLSETLAFYCDELGFSATVYEGRDYAILLRDGMEVHFWLTDDRSLCERSSIYLRGDGIALLHAEFSAKGVKQLTAMAVRPWGMEEFYIHDPHGNLLRFGRRVLP